MRKNRSENKGFFGTVKDSIVSSYHDIKNILTSKEKLRFDKVGPLYIVIAVLIAVLIVYLIWTTISPNGAPVW